jgi:hypothetical protein
MIAEYDKISIGGVSTTSMIKVNRIFSNMASFFALLENIVATLLFGGLYYAQTGGFNGIQFVSEDFKELMGLL